MKITIKGNPKEIVDLVFQLRDRLSEEDYKNFFAPITINGEDIFKTISEYNPDNTPIHGFV